MSARRRARVRIAARNVGPRPLGPRAQRRGGRGRAGVEVVGNHALLNVLTPFLPTWAAQPEDIADAVCWIASDESKMVTAQAISVDQRSPF